MFTVKVVGSLKFRLSVKLTFWPKYLFFPSYVWSRSSVPCLHWVFSSYKSHKASLRWREEREVWVSTPLGIIPLYSSFKKQCIPHARFPGESTVQEHASLSPLPSCFYGQASLWNRAANGHLCPANMYSVCILSENVQFETRCPLGKIKELEFFNL